MTDLKKKVRTDKIAILSLMLEKGIRQNDLAKQIGVSNTAICLELNGHHASERVRIKIADALGVDVGKIFPEVTA